MKLDGSRDVALAAEALAERLPPTLGVFARLAFNYRWSWVPGGADVFRAIDPYRWHLSEGNPVRLLREATPASLGRAAEDEALVAKAERLYRDLQTELRRPCRADVATPERPVAFFCAEFALHRSMPIYSGGLGVLAGDLLKEASDLALPLVGVGLFYRQGYFHQRIDPAGWQHEYWTQMDPQVLPAALVSDPNGKPLTISVPIRGRQVTAQIWRIDVGSVPLYLLDAQRPENPRLDRWITSRLYVGDRKMRLAQYALLGRGGIRALRAMGISPSVIHLNEGHAGLAPVELAVQEVAAGESYEGAVASARSRTVFTTHTPLAAGNEAYTADELAEVVGDMASQLGTDDRTFLGLGRTNEDSADEAFGLTPLGLRMSRAANGVSSRHSTVARTMWQPLYGDAPAEEVPIGHVTNGVHLPTWMAPPMRALLDLYLGPGWERRAADAETWDPIAAIPAEELWAVRSQLRQDLVRYVRDRSVADRLERGEPSDYAASASAAFDPEVLTVGFARRAATYKRLYLLIHDPARALALLDGDGPIQLLLAGKAHPQDEEAKRSVQSVFGLKWAPNVAQRVAYLEDYDLGMASQLIAGCDVWINLPRAPLEACGTSGMKAALNGVLNLSVMDGWWEEAFDGSNGWGIVGDPGLDAAAQDARDAAAMYDLLENEVIPLFYERDANGVPTGWVERIRASMRSIAPRFNATRMLSDYVNGPYRAEVPVGA